MTFITTWHNLLDNIEELPSDVPPDVIEDAASLDTGDERDGYLYRAELDDGGEMDFRWRDLKLIADEE